MAEKYRIKNNIVIWDVKNGLWAIIILPEFIQIDNWHGFSHIHIDGEKIKISIYNTDKVFSKVIRHIEHEGSVNLDKLLEELR